jgi:hypothetical protein
MTAVEWLVEQLFKINNNTTDSKKIDIESIIEQAKEMEEQQGYSEEDLISFAHFYFKEEFNSTMQTSKSTDEILQEWFEQFKKK